MADRPPRVLVDNEVVDIGGKRFRCIDTPHVPHGWDAGVMHEETTATLLCGDLFTRRGGGPPLTENDIVGPAMKAEGFWALTRLGPTTAPNIRKLIETKPRTLALMHGSSFSGDTVSALGALADRYEARLRKGGDKAHSDDRHPKAAADNRLISLAGVECAKLLPCRGNTFAYRGSVAPRSWNWRKSQQSPIQDPARCASRF